MDHTYISTERIKSKIDEVDKITPSPAQRADVIYGLLREKYGDEITTWDITCACIEILALMIPLYPWIESGVKQVSRNVYYAHYFTDIHKEEHGSIASSRISESTVGDGTESNSTGTSEKSDES